jgi:hypothetical protein
VSEIEIEQELRRLGRAIREIREQRGIYIGELASVAGVGQARIETLEEGAPRRGLRSAARGLSRPCRSETSGRPSGRAPTRPRGFISCRPEKPRSLRRFPEPFSRPFGRLCRLSLDIFRAGSYVRRASVSQGWVAVANIGSGWGRSLLPAFSAKRVLWRGSRVESNVGE